MSEANVLAVKVEGLKVTQEHMTAAVKEMAVSVNKLADRLEASDGIAKQALAVTTSHEIRIKRLETIVTWVSGTVGVALVGAILRLVITP